MATTKAKISPRMGKAPVRQAGKRTKAKMRVVKGRR